VLYTGWDMCHWLRWLNLREYRQWGWSVMVVGAMIFVLLGSAETPSFWYNLGAIAVGIAVILLGWFINHCPPHFRLR